jgi:hypothetical protein
MSEVTSQPAVVLRSSYLHVRALLAVALIAIVGLTVAVVVLAISNGRGTVASPTARAHPVAIGANPSAEIGAILDHRGLTTTIPQAVSTADPSAEIGAKLDHRGLTTSNP